MVWREDALPAAWQAVLAGSSRADGGSVGAGTDLRGRPATGAIRLPGGALDAVRHVRLLLNTGHREVVDAVSVL